VAGRLIARVVSGPVQLERMNKLRTPEAFEQLRKKHQWYSFKGKAGGLERAS
jgi:hypothetical protein